MMNMYGESRMYELDYTPERLDWNEYFVRYKESGEIKTAKPSRTDKTVLVNHEKPRRCLFQGFFCHGVHLISWVAVHGARPLHTDSCRRILGETLNLWWRLKKTDRFGKSAPLAGVIRKF